MADGAIVQTLDTVSQAIKSAITGVDQCATHGHLYVLLGIVQKVYFDFFYNNFYSAVGLGPYII